MKAILSDESLSVIIDYQSYIISRSNPSFKEALDAYRANNEEELRDIIVQSQSGVNKYAKKIGASVDDDGRVFLDGKEVHNSIATRIKNFYKEKLPVEPLLRFLERVDQNPSNRSKEELFDFLNNSNLPIDDDGYFYAYKSVSSDFYSKTAGTLTLLQGTSVNGRIYNAVGQTIECKRGDVDDERNNQCSHGLHVGGLTYSGPNGWYNSSGDKVVIVKIDPKDAVSVPKDHSCQKIRVCKYEVVGLYQTPLKDTLYSSLDEDDDDWGDEEDCCEFCGIEKDNYGPYCYDCEDENW